jgi:hypothetical protein
MSADIHSAGLLSIDNVFGLGVDENEPILADHKLLRQSDNLLIGQDYFVDSGGVLHTYARGSALKGHAYYARLAGQIQDRPLDWRPSSTVCSSSLLILESSNSPGEGGDSGGGGETDPGGIVPASPILIDVGNEGFRLTDLARGVRFDINGDGSLDEISWTSLGSRNAWLALDRNQNGLIDDGTELFGNFTAQPDGEEPHGYRALAVFDAPEEGGDGDGWITENDAIYHRLLLWNDVNGNGRSDVGELTPLAVAGVVAIELIPTESRRRDRHGNELRYTSTVRLTRGATSSADVFLLVAWGG